MNRIIIIPDVHGRKFWRKVLENKSDQIVFLGDYSDPYTHEKITHEDALCELEDIIEFKKQNSERVILLYGNHDLSYLDGDMFAQCRYSYQMRHQYKEFFVKQKELFQIAWECKQGEKNYLFTHAGVIDDWIKINNTKTKGFSIDFEKLSADTLNKEFERDPWSFSQISYNRGGRFSSGSPVWADLEEHKWSGNPKHNYHQIFGHTMSFEPCFNIRFTMLDCQKVFVLENNKIEEYKI